MSTMNCLCYFGVSKTQQLTIWADTSFSYHLLLEGCMTRTFTQKNRSVIFYNRFLVHKLKWENENYTLQLKAKLATYFYSISYKDLPIGTLTGSYLRPGAIN